MKQIIFALVLGLPHFAWSAAASFDGSWKQDCQIVDGDALRIKINVSGNEWTWQGIGFEDEQCRRPYLVYEEVYTTQQAKAVSANDYEINLITKEISYTPLSSGVAEALNLSGFCGLKTWKANTKEVVNGLDCDRQIRNVGDLYYQKARLFDDTLLWGLVSPTLNGSTEAKRPQTFEPLAFKK